MALYIIFIKKERQSIVKAESEQEAINHWLDDCGYETLKEAAREEYCDTSEIYAMEKEDDDDRETY